MDAHDEMIAANKGDEPYWDAESAARQKAEGTGTTSNKYRAELYDEVWNKARSMKYANVIDALAKLESAEQRIKESQEQKPVGKVLYSELQGYTFRPLNEFGTHLASGTELYYKLIIPSELEELIDRNQDLCGEIAQINRENAELTRKLAEHEKTVEAFSRMYTQEELNKLLSEARSVPEDVSKNSERYQFLRRTVNEHAVLDALNTADEEPETPDEFDSAVDKAMLAAVPKPEGENK